MADETSDAAMVRIDSALARIESAARRSRDDRAALDRRHTALRTRLGEAIAALDTLIEDGED